MSAVARGKRPRRSKRLTRKLVPSGFVQDVELVTPAEQVSEGDVVPLGEEVAPGEIVSPGEEVVPGEAIPLPGERKRVRRDS